MFLLLSFPFSIRHVTPTMFGGIRDLSEAVGMLVCKWHARFGVSLALLVSCTIPRGSDVHVEL